MPFSLATYNVKDLFVAAPEKLAHLAAVLGRMDADVVGMQEVGSEAALDALLERVPALGYTSRVVGTPDARGIRNVLLSRMPIVSSRVHTATELPFARFGVNDPSPFGARIPLRRGIVHARLAVAGAGDVDVLVVHFKSSRPVAQLDGAGLPIQPRTEREAAEGMLRALASRAAEAVFVRGILDGILASNASAKVAVMGDMNDGPTSLPVRIVAGSSLASCGARGVAGVRWSILHRGSKEEIDHVLASPELLARVQDARFLNEELRDHSLLDLAGPPTSDSDHAPLVVRFS